MPVETKFAETMPPPVKGPLAMILDSIMKLGALVVAAVICVYLLPAVIAVHRPSAKAISWLNLYLGWTVVVWIFVLIWACMDWRSWAQSREMLNR